MAELQGWRRQWQIPLMAASVVVFGYAAWSFLQPGPLLNVAQQIDVGRRLLEQGRAEDALGRLNGILATQKLNEREEGWLRQLMARAVDAGQKGRGIDLPGNRQTIIKQFEQAAAAGVKLSTDDILLLAESREKTGDLSGAVANYRKWLDEKREQLSLADGKQNSGVQVQVSEADELGPMLKKILGLEKKLGDVSAAERTLAEYEELEGLDENQKDWAMASRAGLLIDQGKSEEAMEVLEGIRVVDDGSPGARETRGVVRFRKGLIKWQGGDDAGARKELEGARDDFDLAHELDAQAAYLLGRIALDAKENEKAAGYFSDVVLSHPGDDVVPMARLGRALARLRLKDEAGAVEEMKDVTESLAGKVLLGGAAGGGWEDVKSAAVLALEEAASDLEKRGMLEKAIEVMAMRQRVGALGGGGDEASPAFFGQLAGLFEKRAAELERVANSAQTQEVKQLKEAEARAFRKQAGDANVAWSRSLILSDDDAYGAALWRGIDQYDRSGELGRAIAALRLFVSERPDDPLAPEALLRLGRAHQALGDFDGAIEAYERNQRQYPRTLSAAKSLVPLAQAYLSKGPGYYGDAEATLLKVIEDNPLFSPSAGEFRSALMELANLQYLKGSYEEAIERASEIEQRYPDEPRMGQVLFLAADSYRKWAKLAGANGGGEVGLSGQDKPEDEAVLASGTEGMAGGRSANADVNEGMTAKKRLERLALARDAYGRTIERYRQVPPVEEIEKLQMKLSHFYRADCVFDLGDYEQAIRLYDAAALRFQDDAESLAAHVQIVNAYVRLGRMEEARSANERAKWLVKRMPEEAFDSDTTGMNKEKWLQWMEWSGKSGLLGKADQESSKAADQ